MINLPVTPSLRLDGRRALVAGGSRGIGLAAAAALAEAGAEVTLAARDAAALEAAAAAFAERGLGARTLPLDFSDVAAVRAAMDAFGQLDILVNSACMGRHGPALRTEPDDFDAVTQVNTRAAYFLAQAAARTMQGSGGSINQISSQMGHGGGLGRAVYCLSSTRSKA